jgi:hypothetical protein
MPLAVLCGRCRSGWGAGAHQCFYACAAARGLCAACAGDPEYFWTDGQSARSDPAAAAGPARALHQALESGLRASGLLHLIARAAAEHYVGSSLQFLLPGWEPARIRALIANCAARGGELKWFGAAEPSAFTSRYDHWRFAAPQPLLQTDRVPGALIDMRLPLMFSPQDCALIARLIVAGVQNAANAALKDDAGPAPPAE